MGAWDTGPFDNDAALDLVDELHDTADDTAALDDLLRDTLTLDPTGDVDATDAARALAAATWVAAALPAAGPGGLTLPDDLDAPDPTTVLGTRAANYAALAAQAVTGAWHPTSELRELWEEAGPPDSTRVADHVAHLHHTLSGATLT